MTKRVSQWVTRVANVNSLTSFFSNAENLFTIQILPEPQIQNLDQPCAQCEQKFGFMTTPKLQNLLQTVANTILIINISNSNNSNNLNKFWVDTFAPQGHINQVY